jgi:Leu/Phe-tRNA-protein transferase
LKKQNLVYYLSFDDLKNEDILYNYIYANKDSNYYVSEDFSKDFYIHLAYYGFICTSATLENKFYLLAEIQFEYAILDFQDLHISKKVKKLLKEDNFEFTINTKFEEVIYQLENYHKTNWLEDKYKDLLLSLKDYKHPNIDFQIMSIELNDKNTNELIAAEIGYKIGSIYTSLTGFSSKERNYNNWGKLQLVLLSKYLEENGFAFWNLGHPYMQYKFDLGAKTYSRDEFLKRWLKQIQIEIVK